MKQGKKKQQSNARFGAADILRLLPLIFFVSVTFLLVRIHPYSLPLSQFDFMAESDDTVLYDCFSYVKMSAVIAVTCISVFLFSLYLLTGKRKIRKTILYIPMGIYAFTIVLSYLFSDYKAFALFGTYERFEGTIVHLCYLFMLFYAINCIDHVDEVKLITDTLFVAVTLACLIGLSQLAGHDFFSYGIGKKLLLGSTDRDVTFNFWNRQIYQTVYNINYVGFYMCLVVPILLTRIIDGIRKIKTAKRSGKVYLIWLIVLLLLCLVNIYGADSVGSVPGLLLGVVGVVLLYCNRKIRKLSCVIAPVALAVIVLMVSLGAFGTNLSPFIKNTPEREQIAYIRTHDNTIEFMIDGKLFATDYHPESGAFRLYSENGELPTFQFPDNPYRYEIDDEFFMGRITFTPIIKGERTFAFFDTQDVQWAFEYTGDGVRYVNAAGNRILLDHDTEHAGIFKNYPFGSGRGYIWDTTLPVLKDHLLTGSGADTFMMEFPQDDYAVRFSNGQSVVTVYDKAHSMYLQMAVCFGIPGLIAFLAMIVCSILPYYQKESDEKYDTTAAAIMIGVVAFLISAFVNDSSVNVMPMFYGLLGCGYALSFKKS